MSTKMPEKKMPKPRKFKPVPTPAPKERKIKNPLKKIYGF